MTTILRIHLGNDAALAEEAVQAIKDAGIDIRSPRLKREVISSEVIQIIIALGSAGAFTALCNAIVELLKKHEGWEVTIENKEGKKIIIKGPTLTGIRQLLNDIVPDMEEKKPPKIIKK